ncbi:LysR family transcriptional regulator [Clostridium sp. AM58-1XD]|uniref:LysR family transcriptional regulator n=1 Tax=Clostridium sp. AM58-1XD TaxID=2292307 RepID=UPI000E4C6A6D|nr:LysR family transcriptional regulator [Clostridium sp. AM58-1XD]RGY96674.1 LysR family transcriptional regulator [Clostridium sp. AM58-1XD]
MDLKQVEYIVAIANEQNITRAAQKLFVTQSALTQQLLKLERELQTQLFYRSRNNWHLTPAGEIYIKNARELLRIKQDTYRMIADITQTQHGSMSIGFTPGRGVVMFANVYPAFHKRFPDITVNPIENLVKKQQQMISDGDLDIGFISLRDEQKIPGNRYIKLCSEEFFLVVPVSSSLPEKLNEPVDIRLFSEEPFVLISKDSTMRPIVDGLFKKAGFTPNVLFETSHNPTILTMVQHGLCCGIVSHYYLRSPIPNICAYRIYNMPDWGNYACYRANAYLSEPAKAFIQLAKDYWIG